MIVSDCGFGYEIYTRSKPRKMVAGSYGYPSRFIALMLAQGVLMGYRRRRINADEL